MEGRREEGGGREEEGGLREQKAVACGPQVSQGRMRRWRGMEDCEGGTKVRRNATRNIHSHLMELFSQPKTHFAYFPARLLLDSP